jgi:hypothetical protein
MTNRPFRAGLPALPFFNTKLDQALKIRPAASSVVRSAK